MLLKKINDELLNAIQLGDKVLIERIARKLELYIESTSIDRLDRSELLRAGKLVRKAERIARDIDRRFQPRGTKVGIGRKLIWGPTPDEQLKTALVVAKRQALSLTRGVRTVRLEEVPKIIHCTWAGGGDIATVKSLDGIRSWLRHTKYRVFVWWDSTRLFNMHVRKLLRASPDVRRLYDESATRDRLHIRRVVETSGQYDVEPGSNRHNHRFLTQLMDNNDVKFELTKALWDEVEHDLHPLRELAEQWPDRLLLCDVRSKGITNRIDWLNLDLYERELTLRGMFAAAASDILRYEVLYNFGGVYMDVDIELTGDIGTLIADPELLLVGITPDRAGAPTNTTWKGRDRIECTEAYQGKCLYISNCIVAACPESRAMQAVRQTVRLAYDCMDKGFTKTSRLDPNKLIRSFWYADTTRSTLDLTGPNVVREVLLQIQQGRDWDEIPAMCVARLVEDLAGFNHLGSIPKDFKEAFRRLAYVWRDDDPSHLKFWTWVAKYTVFPMARTKCDTEAAERSDCRTASNQLRGRRAKDLELRKIHPYIPTLKNDTIKGLIANLHSQYKQTVPLPANLDVGHTFIWANAFWQVEAIEKTNKKGRQLPEDKWKVTLQRIG